ncbi:MAG: acetoin utilization protein AcuC [Elusimicrobiota bacterium]
MIAASVYAGEGLARYAFPAGHPFGPGRLEAFWKRAQELGLADRARRCEGRCATREEIERFHSPDYVRTVKDMSAQGCGFLDQGDTPAFPGVFDAAAFVVGSALDAVESIVAGRARRAFLPIGGLHHARRERAAGFCVFNDCGVVIETLRRVHGIRRVAYVDIDAHHGDGVYYPFQEDPEVFIADIHEDGRSLYPGTGSAEEVGVGPAKGTKLNLPMAPRSGDKAFLRVWERAEEFVRSVRPEFILFQCGADSLAGDPIAHLAYSASAHAHAAVRLCSLAEKLGHGRLLAFGGGGYSLNNVSEAWCGVLRSMIEVPVRE